MFDSDFQDGVFVFYSQYGEFPYRMEDYDMQFEFLDNLSFAYLPSVGFVIETRLQNGLGVASMSRILDQI